MALKLFISDFTYRPEALQLSILARAPQLRDAPIFRPSDMSTMFRATQRAEQNTYYAASIGCFAPNEEKFRELLGRCRIKKVCLASIEEEFIWTPQQSTGGAVKAFKAARLNGVAKIGGRISADLREADSKAKIEKIKDRWPLPNTEWSTPILLKEVGLSYNTAIKFLGKRPIAQYNYQAKLKRAAKREERANV